MTSATPPSSIPLDGTLPNAATRRRLRWMHRLRQVVWVVLYLLLCLGGTILSVGTLGRSVYRWHGFAVELRLLPAARGQTALVLMPLGEVQAPTHRAPVVLVATLQEIEIEEINKVLNSSPRLDLLTRDFEDTARRDLRNFVLRQIVFAALGALLAPILLRSRNWWKYLLSAVLGASLVGLVLGSALATFNGKAFESPTYTGTLRQAPWVIQFGKDAFVRIEELSQKLRTVAANLNVLYGRISVPPDQLSGGTDADTIRILHVSDLHNNPAGLNFMQEVARQFRVALIVDTGDLTDFGSPPETAMVEGIRKIGYPYVFVAGNHDSQTVIDAIERLPNVTVLNGTVATVEGFTFLGLPNPASARAAVGNVDTTPEELRAGSDAMLRTLQTLKEPPDILAIHNPEEARPLWGSVPLVLCGHMHRYYVEAEGGTSTARAAAPDAPPSIGAAHPAISPRFETIVCNAGTTGAAGLRYFEKEQGVSFSCAVLTFRRSKPGSQAGAPAPPGSQTAEPLKPGPPVGSGAATPPTPGAAPPGYQAMLPSGQDVTPPVPGARARLAAIDLIVLDGALHQYSITHRPF